MQLNSALSIKVASSGDIDTVRDILLRANWKNWSRFRPGEVTIHNKEMLAQSTYDNTDKLVLLAFNGDVCIGFLSIHVVLDIDGFPAGEIAGLHILPSYQNSGYGSVLLKDAESLLHSIGIVRIIIWVGRNNTRAREFFYRRDFVCTGECRPTADPSDTEDEVEFFKLL